jgi:serine/threonine-protein kinase
LGHRDIKPANIHLSAALDAHGEEVVKVLDFGLAKLLEGQGAYVSAAENLVGTPQFMAPERLVGKPADGRADVYSVGAMLYLMLAGTLPFRRNIDESLISQVIKQINTPPLSIKRLRPELPDEVVELVMSALAQSRRERPALSDIKEELLEWAERWEEPWPPLVGDLGAAPFEVGDTLSVSVDAEPARQSDHVHELEKEKERG